jgi:hypothetical protein
MASLMGFLNREQYIDGWSSKITANVRRFRGVKTIEQYLEKRDQPKKTSASPMMFSDTLRLLIG